MNASWARWLPRQRWYAGRDRTLVSVISQAVAPLGGGLELVVLDAGYTEGPAERYQVVVEHGSTGCDALGRPESARRLLSLIASSAVIGGVRFHREPGAPLPAGDAVRVIAAEQSNTSVVFDERAVLKLFRRVSAGVNPDIELNRVLAGVANPHVARLLGSYAMTDSGEPCPLGMLSGYAAGSVDGWRLATASATSGGFPAEAYRLGGALVSVHADLARLLGTSTTEFPVARMRERLADAAAGVPQLRGYVRAIGRRYDAMAGVRITVQRVHGDLHLGQVLRTAPAWLLIDFEGEPGRPTDERRQPDSPWRDVAGMVRSFGYAAHHRREAGAAGTWSAPLAREWVRRTGAAFVDGYTAASGLDPRAHADVLAAYELDRAVYEAAYEARHRPGWLHIPLSSIALLVN